MTSDFSSRHSHSHKHLRSARPRIQRFISRRRRCCTPLARNHGLVDGNKRRALAATIAFYGMNGMRLTLSNDQAYELVINVATGTINDVPRIASVLEAGMGTS